MKEILTKVYNSEPSPRKEKKRIKLVHLLSLPEEERERESIKNLSKLSRFGITYIQHINKPYTELPPKDSCRYPDKVGMKPGYHIKTPGAYGCYLAHKNAVLKEFSDDVDFLLVCECDCVMLVELREFYNELLKICNTLEKERDIVYVNLGSDPDGWTREPIRKTINNSLSMVDKTVLANCLLYQRSSVDIVKEKFLNEKWDVTDLWQQEVFINHRKAYSKIPIAIQLKGGSLIGGYDETFKVSYCSGVTCEIFGRESDLKYNVKFTDAKTNELIHSDTISVNHWTAPHRKWYTKWRTTITEEISQKEIYSEEFDLKGKKVLISLDSGSLGDTISWIPYLEKFQEKHNCKVFCRTPFSDLFEKVYPNITFINEEPEGLYATYNIGWFDDWQNQDKNPDDPRLIPLQKTASDILGLDHEEEKTRIYIKDKDRPIKEKYVCISTASTSACRHWQNPTGWQETVDYLNALGYKVVVVQKEALDWMDLNGLDNVTHPEEENIQDAVTWLNSCEFFIGLDSGISWLAWALGKKVVSISGFSLSFQRYHTPYKIQNKDVCHGCWNNENFLFDKGDWNWCPIHKGTDRQFECTKSITFDMVKENIDKLINKKSLKIGLQILAYNCKEAFPRLIEPWAKLKKEYNFDFWVNSRQFRIYEEMGSEDVNAETLKMLKNDYSELIDCLSVPEKTLSDHETRTLCLEYFEKKDVDLIWLLDADEFYTEEEIRNVIEYVQENPQYDWYSICFKNYIGDGNKWDDFNPMRIVWRKRHGGMRNYYWDGHFCYKDDTEYKSHPSNTIPKKIAFPDHFTWTNDMSTTGPKHIKEKIEYQKKYYTDGCGYKWNEEKQSIEVNKDNR